MRKKLLLLVASVFMSINMFAQFNQLQTMQLPADFKKNKVSTVKSEMLNSSTITTTNNFTSKMNNSSTPKKLSGTNGTMAPDREFDMRIDLNSPVSGSTVSKSTNQTIKYNFQFVSGDNLIIGDTIIVAIFNFTTNNYFDLNGNINNVSGFIVNSGNIGLLTPGNPLTLGDGTINTANFASGDEIGLFIDVWTNSSNPGFDIDYNNNEDSFFLDANVTVTRNIDLSLTLNDPLNASTVAQSATQNIDFSVQHVSGDDFEAGDTIQFYLWNNSTSQVYAMSNGALNTVDIWELDATDAASLNAGNPAAFTFTFNTLATGFSPNDQIYIVAEPRSISGAVVEIDYSNNEEYFFLKSNVRDINLKLDLTTPLDGSTVVQNAAQPIEFTLSSNGDDLEDGDTISIYYHNVTTGVIYDLDETPGVKTTQVLDATSAPFLNGGQVIVSTVINGGTQLTLNTAQAGFNPGDEIRVIVEFTAVSTSPGIETVTANNLGNFFLDGAGICPSSQTLTICSGDSVIVGTNTYKVSGTYTDNFIGAGGCDSIVTTKLTVLPALTSNNPQTICYGGSYTINGNEYKTAGTYTDVLQSVNGCDSTVKTVISVLPENKVSNAQTICFGGDYTINGNTYSAAGTYNDTLVATNGCDSVVVTTLTILPKIETTQDVQMCQGSSYTYHGVTYTTDSTFSIVLQSDEGCDSTVTTNLTFVEKITVTNNVTVCYGESVTVGNDTYTTAGTHTNTFQSVNGCDSVVTTILTINTPTLNTAVSINEATLEANEVDATYQWIDCDNNNAPISGATSKTFTATKSGRYAVILTSTECELYSQTSDCYTVDISGVEDVAKNTIKVYPNPAIDNVTVTSEIEMTNIEVRDLSGKLIFTQTLNNTHFTLDIEKLSKGVYLVETTTVNGKAANRVVKQ